MPAPEPIYFGRKRQELGFTPENVLNTGFVRPAARLRSSSAPVTSAVLLHEQRMADASTHQMSIQDQNVELERARTLATLTAQRVALATQTRKLVAGAALAEELGGIDMTSPKASQQVAALVAKYPEGSDTEAAKSVMALKRNDYELYTKTQQAHQTEIFKAGLPNRIEAVSKSEHVPGELKNAIVNEDGSVNTAVLSQAEAAAKAGGSRKLGVEHLSAITGALKALDELPKDAEHPQVLKDTIYNLNQALKTGSYTLAGLDQGAPVVPAVDPAVAAATAQEAADAKVRAASDLANGLTPRVAPVAAASATPVATPPAANHDAVAAFVKQFSATGGQPTPVPPPPLGTPPPVDENQR